MEQTVDAAFREHAETLPLIPEFFDTFNLEIQAAIEIADSDLALKLATVKLEANRRLYWASR